MASVTYPRRAAKGMVFLVGGYTTDVGMMDRNVNFQAVVTNVLLQDPGCEYEEVKALREFGTMCSWVDLVWAVDEYAFGDDQLGFVGVGRDFDVVRTSASHSVLFLPFYPVMAPTPVLGLEDEKMECPACVQGTQELKKKAAQKSAEEKMQEQSRQEAAARNARSKRRLELAQKRDAALRGKRTRSGKLSVRKAYRDAFEKAVKECRSDYALGYQPPESVDCLFVRACVLTLEKDDPAALLDDKYMVGSFNPWRRTQLKAMDKWEEWYDFVKNVEM